MKITSFQGFLFIRFVVRDGVGQVALLPVENWGFFSPDIVGGDVAGLPPRVLNPPPVFGVVEQQKPLVSFHVELLIALSDIVIFGNHILGLVCHSRPHDGHEVHEQGLDHLPEPPMGFGHSGSREMKKN